MLAHTGDEGCMLCCVANGGTRDTHSFLATSARGEFGVETSCFMLCVPATLVAMPIPMRLPERVHIHRCIRFIGALAASTLIAPQHVAPPTTAPPVAYNLSLLVQSDSIDTSPLLGV
jgi:hypothetical protein